MGVHGLWKLIEPAGKPVPVETLDDKVLAVDVSIWLHQLMKGYQNPGGSSVSNAYLLGLFSRVCKLLFTNIKPVFVFDGGVPQLKRKTIAARQQQRNKAEQASEKVRELLLKNLLKQKAVSQVLEEIRGQTSPKKKAPDMFELPPLPEVEDSPSEVEEMSTSSSEEDVKPVKMKYKDLHTINVNSADFKALPADMRHDILTELKETRKQNSWGRIHEMPEESGDFSKYQMSRLLKRRSVQVSLEEAEKEMGGRTLSLVDVEALLAEGGIEINPQLSKRIASDDVTRYIYVRETGEQSKSQSPSSIASISTDVEQKDRSSTFSSEANLVKIKEEVMSSDECSDVELIKEVEAIETMHNITIKEENNEEFGTENMFEEESSSEGVIIDDMDLVKDSSGLSQEQILAVIKQQNLAKSKFNQNEPSTSKTETFSEENSENNSKNVEESVAINTSLSLTTLPVCPESKILDSVYFKMSKRIQTVIQKQNKNKISQKPKSIDKSVNGSKTSDSGEHMLIKPVDLSALAADSCDSEDDKILNLPCEISEITLPNTSNRTIKNITNKINSDSLNKLSDIKTANTEQIAELSSSSDSADDDFLEVMPSNEATLGPNDNGKTIQGLQIEIQSNQNTIEDDIFADIFLNSNDVPVNTTSNSSSKKINHFQNNKLFEPDSCTDNQNENTKPSVLQQNITKKDDMLADILSSNLNHSKVTGKQSSTFSLPTKPLSLLHNTTKTTPSDFQKERSNIIEDFKKKENTTKKLEKIKHILDEDPAGIFDPNIDSDDSEDMNDPPSEPASPKHIVSCDEPKSEVSSDEMSVKSEELVPTDDKVEQLEELTPINHNADSPSKYTSIHIDKKNQVFSNVESTLESTSSVLDTQKKAEIEPTPKISSNTHETQDKPKRTLDSKQLEKLQEILENKERELVVDQNREDRVATSLTDQMYQEAQELLRLFGVPYVVAPMEAEAQCAFMDAAGLTQGTITDDSDIWLFGGRKVYKNFFDQKKFVLEFQADNIHNYFKLSRNHLVLMALLVGSDYTVGLQGVGAVTAMEILATFPPARQDTRDAQELLTSLIQFKQWWQATPLTHAPLAKKLKNIDLHQGFPSPAVVSAYLDPQVDDSREAFSWGEPDLPGLRDYAERKFGWSRNRTDQILLPVVNRLSKKTSQLTLHTFFGAIPNITAHREQMSRRVQSAVHRLEGGSDELEPIQQRPRQPRRRGRGRTGVSESEPARGGGRGTGRGRGRVAAEDEEQLFIHDSVGKAPEMIPQREKDRQEALKRKQQAVEILKNKKRKGMKKRRNVRQEKAEANLSESSSDDN